MKKIAALLIILSATAVAQMGSTQGNSQPAQQPSGASSAPQQPASEAFVLDRNLRSTERDVVPAAEAMPADKFDFAPNVPGGDFKGVRTFARQVKHIASTNFDCATRDVRREVEFVG